VKVYAFADLSALVINSLFGIYVYGKNPRGLPNKVFAILMLSVCVWQFGEFNLINATEANIALFWDRLLYVGLILTPTMTFLLALVFPSRRAFLESRLRVFLLFVPSLFLLLLLPTDFFISGVQSAYWGFGKTPGPLFWLFRIHLSVFILLTLATFYCSYRAAKTGRERIQSKYLMAAIGLPGTIGILILIVFQPLGLDYLNTSVAALASIIGTGILAYAIVKHRLMDIDIVFTKGTAYAFSLVVVTLPSVALALLLQYRRGEIDYVLSFSILTIVSLGCILFAKIKPRVETAIEKTVFRGKYLYKSILTEFSKEIVTIIDLSLLCKKVIDTITRTMRIDKASIFIYEEEKSKYVLQEYVDLGQYAKARNDLLSMSRGDALIKWLGKNRSTIVREEWEKRSRTPDLKGTLSTMKHIESEVCIPLLVKARLIGFINLGKKSEKGLYSGEEIDLLETLANQTAIAMENAKLYEDLKRQKAIMRRADRLASLGTLTAGLAHEIRNPLVAIKTLTQLLPERIDDEEFRKDFLAIASGEVDRISSLVNELLEFARPTKPQLQYENLSEIMDGMVLLISTEVKKQNLEITTEYGENIPPVPIDREQIKQVFLNILLNATEATDEGGMVGVEIRTFATEKGARFVQVEIRDTGRGIPEEHLDNIFTPFFTTKKKGSGLGLSNAHQIIQEHGGTITVESRVGKGSSFCINLPVSPEVREDKVSADKESHVSQPLH